MAGDTGAEARPAMHELLYAVPAGLIILATGAVAVYFGLVAALALGQVIEPPPFDPDELNKQSANTTDVILLGLMSLSGGIALLIAVRCWIARQWRILVVPVALAPVLLALFVLLAINNWQY